MDFKSLLSQLDQLNEATDRSEPGKVKHSAEPGGYGRKDDEDDEGNRVKSTAVKKGKGRPKKDADDSGETKKYDFSAFGVKSGKDVKLPKHDKKKTTVVKGKSQSHAANKKDDGTGDEEPKTKAKKKSLKEYFDSLDKALNENEISSNRIANMNKPNQEFHGKNPHFGRGTEVKSIGKTVDASGKPVSALATKVTPKFNKPGQVQRMSRGSFNSPVEEAEQIQVKPASQMPKQPGQTSMQKPGQPQQVAGQPAQNTQVIAQGNKTLGTVNNPQLAQQIKQSIGKGEMTLMPDQMQEEDMGKHNNATTGFDALVRKLTPKYGAEAAKRIAGAKLKKIREADQPPNDSLLSPMSEARAKADDKAEKAGKKVTKDLEYDMKHKGKDDNKAEKAGKKVTKDIEYDEKKKIKEAKFKQEYRIFLESKGIKVTNEMLEEGWKEKLGAAALAGSMALGSLGAAPAQASPATPTTATAQQQKAVWSDAYQKAYSFASSGANENFKNTFKAIDNLHKSKTDDIITSTAFNKNNAGKNAELKKQLDIQFKNDLEKLLQSYSVKESKKPDANKNGIPDYAEDGKGKNDLKKKKVKEGMEHKLKAARHVGKAHALSKQGYNCNYDDMEESRHYHEGFKEGLDECYGQMPIQGYVGETNNEVADMASYGAHTPQIADEGNAFTAALKKTPQGSKFTLGGKSFTDHSSIEESPFAFEAWDKELNAILEGKDVTEGMTVSISKGQQGTPDSVSVSAQDSEADQLLSIIKQSGLGLFGGDDAGQPQATSPMTVDGSEAPQAEIEVVDDHDDMLSLIRKMTGQGPAQASGDYEEEGGEEMHGHEHGEEETCNECGGMMEEGHSCGEAVEEDEMDDGEAVEEDESMDQREYEVAEEINPNNNDEAEEEQTDATRDAALATAAGKNFADTDAPLEEGGDGGEAGTDAIAADDAADEVNAEEEDLDESYANGDDDTFETDIDFMTKVISGGLNKQKSTGQTTIPVVSTQVNRLGSPMRESTDLLHDWKKLSGIK